MKVQPAMNATEQIDNYISEITDWRRDTLSEVRQIIRSADPGIIEEWKWMGSPVWSCNGVICVGNAHKEKVKVTFGEGALLPDPDGLFNNGFGGNKYRAIDLYEGDKVNANALTQMVRAAIAHNNSKPKRKPKAKAATNE